MNYLFFAGGPLNGQRTTQCRDPGQTVTAYGRKYHRIASWKWFGDIRVHTYEAAP